MARRNAKSAPVENHDWKLPSNHQNLLFMLANGLITGPDGFGYEGESRYYKDIMALYQGMIPLFKHFIPESIRSVALEESGNLIRATAILNMKEYMGEMYVCTGRGWELKPYAEIVPETRLIAVPAPLPAAWITGIAFDTKKDIDSFRSAADDFGNVDLPEDLRLSPQGASAKDALSLMSQEDVASGAAVLLPEAGERDIRIDLLEKAQALGGIMAMLYHLADKSDLGAEIFKKTREAVLSPDSCNADSNETGDMLMRGIPRWIAGKAVSNPDWRTRFFFGLLDHIITSRRSYSSTGVTAAAREYVLKQLHSPEGSQNWQKGQKLLDELLNTTLSPSKLFEEFNGEVSHALLIFFERDRCEDLLEFSYKNPDVALTDADTIASALLFGAREGWSGLAKQYRRGLSQWVTSLMALKAQYQDTAAIRLNGQDCKPLREFFTGDAWDMYETRALEVARKHKWQECLFTRVKVPKSYSVDDGYIILPGDTAAKVIVEKDKFLIRLREAPSDEKEIIRKNLGIVK